MANPEQALFDSWQQGRKQGMSAGIRYEQERIIELLEDSDILYEFRGCGCCSNADKDDVIALIKGEKE